MALEDILQALRTEGEEEVARIREEGDEAVATLLQAARRDAKQAEADATVARDDALTREAAIIRHRAELHVERRLQEASEEVFQEILGRAKDRLSRYRQESDYPAALNDLVDECAAFLGTIEELSMDPRDEGLGEEITGRFDRVAVQMTLDTWGGVVAHDGNGVYVRNTLEDRLGRAESDLRRRIGDLVPGLGARGEAESPP